MKIFGVNFSNKKENVNFDGTRTLRNTVSQLAKNNKYSLNEPNQRYITNSITELGKISGEKNIKFLLSKIIPLVAHNLEYQSQNRHNLYIQVFCKNVVQIRQLG